MSASLIGRLPSRAHSLGPVAAVSFRVASRIANSLRAGTAVRSAGELNSVRTVVFQSPPEQAAALLEILQSADIQWPGKSLIICDSEASASALEDFRSRGASVAALKSSGIPGRLVLEGTAPALTAARGMARELAMKCIEIADGSCDAFQAAVTLGSAALTPLIDHAAHLLRKCGVRDSEAPLLAAAVFEQTAREFAHSGRQSWGWHTRAPDIEALEKQIGAAGEPAGAIMRELLLLGLEAFDKHPAEAKALRRNRETVP